MTNARTLKTALLGVGTVLLVLGFGGLAPADTIFDNGPPNVDNGQDITTAIMAEDFEVGASAVIGGATFSLLDLNGSELAGWDGTIQWGIYSAVSGVPFTQTKPGPQLFGGSASNITAAFDHQNPNGRQFYNVAFDFGQDVPIAANTRYWFGLHVNQGYGQQYLFWTQTSSAYFETTYARQGGQGNWFYQGLARNSFTLVPEPGTAGLLLLALTPFLRRRAAGRLDRRGSGSPASSSPCPGLHKNSQPRNRGCVSSEFPPTTLRRSETMRNGTICALTLIGFALSAGVAPAQADVFTDRALFDAANPGLPSLDFEGMAPPGDFVFAPDFSASGVTFADPFGDLSFVAVADSAVMGTPSDILAQADNVGILLVTLDPPVSAVGFDIAILDVTGQSTSVMIQLFNGASELFATTFSTSDFSTFDTFRGFSNLGADVTSILISPQTFAPTVTLIDNFSHGVPEPGALALLTLGVLTALRRR